jgi:hypothetical protein
MFDRLSKNMCECVRRPKIPSKNILVDRITSNSMQAAATIFSGRSILMVISCFVTSTTELFRCVAYVFIVLSLSLSLFLLLKFLFFFRLV